MAEYNFERSSSRIRLWIDEQPDFPAVPREKLWNLSSLSCGTATPRHSSTAIEYFRPRGGMYHYGLLAAHLGAESSDGLLQVRVPVSSRNSALAWSGSLNRCEGDTLFGFAQEYTPAIVEGVHQCSIGLPRSGQLTFTAMAHSKVGSVPLVFHSLAKAVVRSLSHSHPYRSVEDVLALMDE